MLFVLQMLRINRQEIYFCIVAIFELISIVYMFFQNFNNLSKELKERKF